MISLLVPTRGRPKNIERFSRMVTETVSGDTAVEVVWYLDDDDLDSETAVQDEAYRALMDGRTRGKGNFVRHGYMQGPRVALSEAWNSAWNVARGDIFGLLSDDAMINSPEWDQLVLTAFDAVPDHIALAYGQCDASRCMSYPFIGKPWAEVLNRVAPPTFSNKDGWLFHLAADLGREIPIADLCIDHQPIDGQAVHVQLDQRDIYDEGLMRSDRAGDLRKLTLAIDGIK